MNSLRNRIAALLIFAIVSVVGLATFAALRTLQPPSPASTIEPVALQLGVAVLVAEKQPELLPKSGFSLQAEPHAGAEDGMLSRFLEIALTKNGLARTALITRDPSSPAPIASIALETGGWLVTEIPDHGPPPGGWKTFGMWIGLIVAGSAIIAIFAAVKITKPLQLLQNATRNIRPDGSLPDIPETGAGEIRATAAALNSLSARLKTSVESRMRLVAAAGHDLRTPMTRMRLRAEFIEDATEQAKWLSDLEELDAIADSAIQLVREEVSQDTLVPVVLGDLLMTIVKELGDIGYRDRLQFTAPDTSIVVKASPFALKRALSNLVLNAVTHGLRAEIGLETDGAKAVLFIRDNGPGIPAELIERIFEPFFRVDMARRKSAPGAGLGLAIAKEIIERFSGTITVVNRQPHGLVQTVTFPVHCV